MAHPRTTEQEDRPETVRTSAAADWLADIGTLAVDATASVGNFAIFSGRAFAWLFTRFPRGDTLWPNFYQVGVLSLPVVAITGTFIGMVLAVQSYAQFRQLGLASMKDADIRRFAPINWIFDF